jgi:predicted transcriptional regulator
MDKTILNNYILNRLSISEIAKNENCSNTTIRYWLKKYNLKTFRAENKNIESTHKYCPMCQTTKPVVDFYNRRNKKGNSPYCKPCTNVQVIERQRNLKQLAIDYKGGCCEKCGYNKYNGALEFHHLDPTQKDFTIAHLKLTSFNETIKKELDKCILVCANCHREIHGGL